MMKNTIAATLTVASRDTFIELNVSLRKAPARIITPSTPHAAASVGVAMPRTIKPMTIKTTKLIGRMLVLTSLMRVVQCIGSTK